jgi:hypothetical protein
MPPRTDEDEKTAAAHFERAENAMFVTVL